MDPAMVPGLPDEASADDENDGDLLGQAGGGSAHHASREEVEEEEVEWGLEGNHELYEDADWRVLGTAELWGEEEDEESRVLHEGNNRKRLGAQLVGFTLIPTLPLTLPLPLPLTLTPTPSPSPNSYP
jgi:hypothetical protein